MLTVYIIIIFLKLDIYKLNIQIQFSLMIGNLYLAGLITDNIKIKKKILYNEQASGGKISVNKKEVPG